MLRATVPLSACAISAALAVGPARAQAPIVTDGTMGARAELNGPAMQIPHTLGTQAGPNLFHSFQRFNIPTQNSATFTGPGGIDNVISRVTGGEASTIDGTFRSTIPGANVWFTNPAGVTFGPNASLDVPASFHASTADEIRFPDGGRFSADLGATSTLSVAPPEAFGFLSSNPAPLKVERSHLSTVTDATLSLAAGEIDIQGNAPTPDPNLPEFVDITSGTLRAPSGTINLASVAGPAEVKTDGTVSGNNHGAIRLTNGALVNASGDGAGVVRIRGGELTATGSYVLASNTGSLAGAGGIDISADRISLQDDGRFPSLVAANAHTAGNAAPINVRAQDITIQNQSSIGSLAYAEGKAGDIHINVPNQMTLDNFARVLASSVSPDPAGAAGDIMVTAGHLVIRGQSQIATVTIGPAPAGNIDVTAGTLLADGPSTVQRLTGITAAAESELINGQASIPGKAGNISVNANEIRLANGAQITSYTQGPGDAGNINIIVPSGTLIVEDGSAISNSTYAKGNAGVVRIEANNLTLNNGDIGGSTRGSGKAGNISINAANRMTLDNGSLVYANSLSLDPATAGGEITVNAGNLVIRGQSQINTLTRGPAPAGNITVTAGTLLIDALATGQEFPAGISASARSSLDGQKTIPGKAGNITIRADEIRLTNGANIRSETEGPGDAGNITIIVPSGTLIVENGSAISNSTYAKGNAGAVRIEANNLTLNNGDIGGSTRGSGKAGNISINAANRMTLDNGSLVYANSLSLDPATAGGEITVNAGNLVIRGQSQINTLTRGPAPAGNITVTAGTLLIDALATGQEFPAGISASARSSLDGQKTIPGKAGNITIRADEIRLTNGANIRSETEGPGDAGNITIIVPSGTLIVENGSAISNSTYAKGNAGAVRIEANNLTLNNGDIGGSTRGSGKAGNISINAASRMTLDNGSLVYANSLSLDPATAGGEITVNAGNLVIRGQSQINTLTRGPAPAGNITVTAGTLLIDALATGQEFPAGISASARSSLDGQKTIPGKAGNIIIRADEIRLTNGANIRSETEGPGDAGNINIIVPSGTLIVENDSAISSRTYAKGNAGTINITANKVLLSNAGIFSASGGAGDSGTINIAGATEIALDRSIISTQAVGAGGGRISIKAGKLLYLKDSGITTAVAGGPETTAGDINIDPQFVVLNNSRISAQATRQGTGGNIRIVADHIFRSPESVISASSALGLSGTVNISSPETDVTVDVAQLPGAVMNTADQMQERCAVRGLVEGSSFTIAGLEALSPTLEGYLPGTYARVADEDTAVTDGSLMVASGGGLAFPVWTVACGDAG